MLALLAAAVGPLSAFAAAAVLPLIPAPSVVPLRTMRLL